MPDSRPKLVLIGPLGVGKSTVAKLLSEELGIPRCCYDEIKMNLLTDAGFNLKTAHQIRDEKGIYEMCQYTNSFGIETLTRLFADYPDHIIDLGAGSYCFDEPAQIEQAKSIFAKLDLTILLMPDSNLGKSIRLLPGVKQRRYMNAHFVLHPLNYELSDYVVYTHGNEPETTAYEVGALIQA